VSTPAIPEVALSANYKQTARANGRKSRIGYFGMFGMLNIGNECTLQAILYNVRSRRPGSEVFVVSYDPADTRQRHGLESFPVTWQDFSHVVRRPGLSGQLARLWRIVRRIPAELNDWWKAVPTLRGTDVLIMTGTGMLTDYMTTAFGFPYEIFRWTTAARLAGCKVRFVAVGVSPIYGRLSRLFIIGALSLADYRSFRDQSSKERIKKNGFDRPSDPVCPDLAFSLPPDLIPNAEAKRETRRVGIGVMEYRDIHRWSKTENQARYSSYLDEMSDFVVWLLDHNYSVRILQGDARHDVHPRTDLKARLAARGIHYEQGGVVDEGSTTVEELIAQIAEVDVVISPRFHNLVLALMMKIPVISLSYDSKNDQLLEGFGLNECRQLLYELDLHKLIRQLGGLETQFSEVKPRIETTLQEYRRYLDEQYAMIFGESFPSLGLESRP